MSTFAELAERRFQFLKDRGFHVTRRIVYPSHDDAEVAFDSSRCRIRLVRDRSFVGIDLAPPAPSEAWCDLPTVLYYLSGGSDKVWDFQVPDLDRGEQRTDWQLQRWADILRPYLDRACQFFSEMPEDVIEQTLTDAMNKRFHDTSGTS
jgi:hypothetical protein